MPQRRYSSKPLAACYPSFVSQQFTLCALQQMFAVQYSLQALCSSPDADVAFVGRSMWPFAACGCCTAAITGGSDLAH